MVLACRSIARCVPVLILLALLAPGAVSAQNEPGLAMEINRYYGEQNRALVEGAVEIPYLLLAFAPNGGSLRANALVEVMVERSGGEEVYRTEHEITPEAANQAMAGSDRVSSIETFAIYAPPGEYVARARVTDLATNRTYEMSAPLAILAERPVFSDVLLSNHVQKDVRLDEGMYLPYLIGTTMFGPNPRNVFYKDAPLLYFYYEVDPAVAAGPAGTSVELQMSVRDASGAEIKNLGKRQIMLSDGRHFDLGAFNIGGLLPGRYALAVSCSSCPGGASMATPFEVRAAQAPAEFLEPPPAATAAAAPRFYAELSPAQVDSVIGTMDILFSVAQRDLLQTLSPGGKVQFLNRFWESADSRPETPENEEQAAFEQRLAYADQFFSSSQRAGHATDRGRIYLLFGEPTETFNRPVEATLGAYVIWNYSNQGKTFAFGDFRKDGDYKIIYSTDQRFAGDPTIQSQVDNPGATPSEGFLRGGRGYETIIEDIRTNRTNAGFQQ